MSLKNSLVTAVSYIRKSWKRKLISISKSFKNEYGIEIGGPSPRTFGLSNIFPIYVFANSIDGVNFSTDTIWEGKIKEGNSYTYFQQKTGYQYIAEATDLSRVETGKYDFVLSSHSLEHVANPIKALKEWNRVLKKGGRLVLLLPDKNHTFDRYRDYTSFQHLLEDYKANTKENDTTHFAEIMQKHDSTYDVGTDKATFEKKLKSNYDTRIVHHHVFSLELIKELLQYVGFKTTYQQVCPPFHLVTIAEKVAL